MQRPGLGHDLARDLMVAPSRLLFTMPSFCLLFDLPCCPAANNVHAVLGKLFETNEVKSRGHVVYYLASRPLLMGKYHRLRHHL